MISHRQRRSHDAQKAHGNELLLAALTDNACRGKVRHASKSHARAADRQALERDTAYRRGPLVLNRAPPR